MRRRSKWLSGLAAVALLIGGGVVATSLPASAAAGFTVSGSQILDANGNAFVMRGVNHAHTWYTSQFSSFENIKATGANTVRVVLSSGNRWTKNDAADVTRVIDECKRLKLICVLEAHDTTGYGEDGAAATLAQAVDYWISIKSALDGQESYTILNIGNEPYGNTNAAAWTDATKSAIGRLREAGFQHAIMVDAPNWGQDWQFVMRDNAASVLAADPQGNTIFDIHMYGVFDTAAEITDYLGRFQSANLPIVVGEFGFDHSDGNPDEDAIMATAESLGIGYLGWSWSGNGGGVEYLDLVTGFDPAALSTWGERLINGANGIRATAEEASVYGGGGTPTTSPSSASPSPSSASPSPSGPVESTLPPPVTACTATYTVSSSWDSGFQGTVTVTASEPITGWVVTWLWRNGQTFTNTWNAAVTNSGGAVWAENESHNGTLATGASTTWGFTATHTGANPAPTGLTCNAA
jgi:mannan endo-1,4-beta-mannosidase